ncbi:hypothetical protein A4X09_0g2049 [Tilletia walkeri]|uniref:CobW/HypB/UreG nucleotide-binding domain-containing protein n=1 Tax=Tilletia walkeri TaxID=117179 RepID=A0A8X7NBL3_9BASI|nr:hypothetical protein A4X09_0g2049 [Tilletia walkeri]
MAAGSTSTTAQNAAVCDFKLTPGSGSTSDPYGASSGTQLNGAELSSHSHEHEHSHSHTHDHSHAHDHGHTHDFYDHPGKFHQRDRPNHSGRDWNERAFTVGIGGPVGSGKTALLLALCQRLRERLNIGVVTNDIFTAEDREFLHRHSALEPLTRIRAVETGGCPHAAIREDISSNIGVLEEIQAEFETELLFVESGGDNLAAAYSVELADFEIYVIDVAGGDKVPRKGGPGVSQSDLLVVNKIDLAPHVGADLGVMKRDADKMRDGGPVVFAAVKHGDGVDDVIGHILQARKEAGAEHAGKKLEPSAQA